MLPKKRSNNEADSNRQPPFGICAVADGSPPVPSLPLADALLFADTMPQVLQILGQGMDRWMEAIVLATPFWAPGIGRMNMPINLGAGVPALAEASLRFDPDRELRIHHYSPFILGQSTKGLLATLERVRVDSHLPPVMLPSLIGFMPKLTSIHIASAEQMEALLKVIPHASVEELGVSSFRKKSNLGILQPLTSLRKLTLDGCKELTDITALKSLTKLEELRLSGCEDLVDVSPLASLTSLRAPAIDDVRWDPLFLDEDVSATAVPGQLLGTYAASLRSDDPATRAHGEVMIRKIVSVDRNPWAYDVNTDSLDIPDDLLWTCIDFMRSSVPAENLQGARMIRQRFDSDEYWLGDAVEFGCVGLFVHHLLCDDLPELQKESAVAIGRIAESGQDDTITSNPHVLLNLFRLIMSPAEKCRIHAAWVMERLASASIASRDFCLKNGVVKLLLVVASAEGVSRTADNTFLALSSCCQGQPPPEDEQIAGALPLLAGMLHHGVHDIVESGVRALADLSQGSAELIDRICSTAGCLVRILELLNDDSESVMKAASRCVRNVARGSDSQVQALINAGALQKFPSMLTDSEVSIRKDAVESVSIIIANHPHQVPVLIAATIFPALLSAAKAGGADVTEHAVRALLNTMSSSSVSMDHFVEIGALQCLGEVAARRDEQTMTIAVEAMEKITKTLTPA